MFSFFSQLFYIRQIGSTLLKRVLKWQRLEHFARKWGLHPALEGIVPESKPKRKVLHFYLITSKTHFK